MKASSDKMYDNGILVLLVDAKDEAASNGIVGGALSRARPTPINLFLLLKDMEQIVST